MKKSPQKPSTATAATTKYTNKELADHEYSRLISLYTAAGVDSLKLKIYDSLIRKVAELFGILEAMKDMQTLKVANNTTIETGAGKARVKYMAQYTNSMTKLNRDLMGTLSDASDDELEEFE